MVSRTKTLPKVAQAAKATPIAEAIRCVGFGIRKIMRSLRLENLASPHFALAPLDPAPDKPGHAPPERMPERDGSRLIQQPDHEARGVLRVRVGAIAGLAPRIEALASGSLYF
jgi:hypothetical protein